MGYHGDYNDSDKTPITLAGKHGARWMLLAKDMEEYILRENEIKNMRIRGFVELGDGKIVKSTRLEVPRGKLTLSESRDYETGKQPGSAAYRR